MNTDIHSKLLGSRKELLDLGLRNSLINFRPSRRSLAIVDEKSAVVLDVLYNQHKAMTFLPLAKEQLARLKPEGDDTPPNGEGDSTQATAVDALLMHELEGVAWDQVIAGDAAAEADDAGSQTPARRHTDTRLQTALSDDRLFLSLLRIQNEAESYLEEQGVNVLFLALGFLHWYEDERSEIRRKAPLLLVPVSLKRAGAREAFRLEYTGDDLVSNLSLAAKLKADFRIEYPELALDSEEGDTPTLERFYAQVREAITRQPRWQVADDDICLGFFSFGKFLMFNDLDPAVWPEGAFDGHPVLAPLLSDGFGDDPGQYPEDAHLDRLIAPGDIQCVKDADSSQTLALLESRGGRSLVIQGPPGTGKSQTITNIIADCLGQGKRVLFVAEKMAALEVVKRRLDDVHLGDAVLELHSHKSNRLAVVQELGRTLQQGKPLAPDGRQDLARLREVRDQLNAYADVVNAPVLNSNVPFIEALGHWLALREQAPADLPAFDTALLLTQDAPGIQARREHIDLWVRHLGTQGVPDDNPFAGAARESVSPLERDQAQMLAGQAGSALQHARSALAQLSKTLAIPEPACLSEADIWAQTARRRLEAPVLDGVDLQNPAWTQASERIVQLMTEGQGLQAARAQGQGLIDAAWDQDLLLERQFYAYCGHKWWRIFIPGYHRARRRLQGLHDGPLPKGADACLMLIDAVLQARKHSARIQEEQVLGQALFGLHWRGPGSDWNRLGQITDWRRGVAQDMAQGTMPASALRVLVESLDLAALQSALDEWIRARQALDTPVQALANLLQWPAGMASSLTLDALALRLHGMQSTPDAWYAQARTASLLRGLQDLGLGVLAAHLLGWRQAPAHLRTALDLCWYGGLVQRAYADHPELYQFDREAQAQRIEQFRTLDQQTFFLAQSQLATQIWESMPRLNQPGELAILRNEINKKRRHIPIRQLMIKAGRAIQQIKPVFMMSPMSIATFLPPGQVHFDVVIFDEASQVKAVDAFGAILRGDQAIVVGDNRQMPPTDFFGREAELDDGEDNVTQDIESILSLFRARGARERYLRWHYRSRHESLIAVSNAAFYEHRLVVFPSAGRNPDAIGLQLHHLPEALYDRGRTRTNPGEARAVAEAILQHARTRPHLSLGVVAFSVAQRDLLQVELERLRRQHPETEAFFTQAHPHEPFFIKNLENVQGDERDIIFISIGYGRNETGKVAKNFGPLNLDGGERRLNVLITRAKLGMEVFSNFTADDLDLAAGDAFGLRALKQFLHYARTRQLDVPQASGQGVDSPFEAQVIRALRARGHQVEGQVGTAGYFIDIGVKDPDQPGRYLLGIECDGASYHSSRSARDRDRLRQSVLEGLGWRFHRIWSTDWFRHPDQELARIETAIAAAREDQPPPRRSAVVAETVLQRQAETKDEAQPLAEPYRLAALPDLSRRQLTDQGVEALAQLLQAVVAVESPIHESDAQRRVMGAFGVTRGGSRVNAVLDGALDWGVRWGHFVRRDGFLWRDAEQVASVRDRRALESGLRRIEGIAPEELDAALCESLRLGFSLAADAAVSSALSLLGFGRATSKLQEPLRERLDVLVATGRVSQQGEAYRLAT